MGNFKTRAAPGEAFVDVVSDRGSTPLASTSKSTSMNERLDFSMACGDCSEEEKELLKLIKVKVKRKDLLKYYSSAKLISKYLPHIELPKNLKRKK